MDSELKTGTVFGCVVNEITGEKIRNAYITLEYTSMQGNAYLYTGTDEFGYFIFDNLTVLSNGDVVKITCGKVGYYQTSFLHEIKNTKQKDGGKTGQLIIDMKKVRVINP